MHYLRWKRHGDPLKLADPNETHKKLSDARNGKITSPETRKKMSESMKKRKPNTNSLEALRLVNKNRVGTKLPEIVKEKVSISLKKKWTDPEYKKKMILVRQKQFSNPEITSKISKSLKDLWTDLEYKKRQSKSHKGIIAGMLGKKHSIETRKKLSLSHKGQIPWSAEKPLPEKTKKKISMKKKKWFEDHPEERKKSSIRVQKWLNENPEFRIQASKRRSKQIFPFRDSKIELQTQEILTNAGIEFEKHTAIKIGNSYHQADILILPNKIIEVNGDYWHFNPRKYHAEQQVRIRNKTVKVNDVWDKEELMLNKLREIGYEILIVWDHDLKKNTEQTRKKILEFAEF